MEERIVLLRGCGFIYQVKQVPYLAVVDSVAKLVASGASFENVWLSFQEYFAKPGRDPKRWGKPLSALLGAFRAQMDLGVGAIGGKDSMSGSFEKLDVPPTLVSFAVTADRSAHIQSPEFKRPGSRVALLAPQRDERGLPKPASLLALFAKITALHRAGKLCACWAVGPGGVLEAVLKMAFGNGYGFRFAEGCSVSALRARQYGSFVAELTKDCPEGETLGFVTEARVFTLGGETVDAEALCGAWEHRLESVYPCGLDRPLKRLPDLEYRAEKRAAPAIRCAKPRFLIPVFPGTNCEYDSAKAVRDAGAEAELFILNNLSADGIRRSVERFAARLAQAQAVFLPGGFSGGDEPDGSGKFITAFFRNAAVKEGVTELLERRDGLMLGVCNGFQALIKLGLVPYGRITEPNENSPTLTFNTIGRHQSRIVRTRIVSNKSPWFAGLKVGDVVNVPISHGEGRFVCPEPLLKALVQNGQIATQYVDLEGHATFARKTGIDYAVVTPGRPPGLRRGGPAGGRRDCLLRPPEERGSDRGQQGLRQGADEAVRHPHGPIRGLHGAPGGPGLSAKRPHAHRRQGRRPGPGQGRAHRPNAGGGRGRRPRYAGGQAIRQERRAHRH